MVGLSTCGGVVCKRAKRGISHRGHRGTKKTVGRLKPPRSQSLPAVVGCTWERNCLRSCASRSVPPCAPRLSAKQRQSNCRESCVPKYNPPRRAGFGNEENDQNRRLFRIFFRFRYSVIVSNFVLRIANLSPRHRIMRAEGHPRHAAEQARCSKPKAFWETVREHRFLGVAGAGRLEPAMDETIGKWLQEHPVPAKHKLLVKRHRDLFPRWLRPIANRRGSEDNRRDPNDPDPAPPYGWPQCGQTGLPSMRFFLQCGHTTRLTFGRVTRWTISPTTGTSQPRIVTS